MIIFPFRAKIINEILFEIRVKNNYISGSFFFYSKKPIILIYLKSKQDITRYCEVIYDGYWLFSNVDIILVILVCLKLK